ncbi:drug/metabolite transporter [Halomonas salifodinae]|uniref:drug/metabolite transporter n=1 Tax=Halomonas salifodinae TaxID=438745 RepID=UPI0033A0A89E
MSPAALGLVLVSVCLHAGWNLLGKRRAPSLAFFTLAIAAGGLAFSPLLLLGPPLASLPASFWGWLAASGLCQMLYMGGLAWAYARGEVSVLYPLARALPVVLVPLVAVGLLGSHELAGGDLAGMGLILAGALCLPLAGVPRLASYLTPALGFALLAALATAGYSLIDARALGLMVNTGMTPLAAGAVFMVLQALVTPLWALPLLLIMPSERRRLPVLWAEERLGLLVTGLMITATYGLVLVALAQSDSVSHIVALRQLSIPLGVMLGILWLRERAAPAKLVGTAIMLAGLWLVALD